jgi:carboxyl-terminal processing protease
LLDSGYAYVSIYSFSDDDRLSILLWERMMRALNTQDIPGLIIDMRHNGGGSGWLANQMAAYFFDEALDLGNGEVYDEALGEFYLDPSAEEYFYLPDDELRYRGEVAVLVSPNCVSACEFFSRNLTLQNRAEIIGQYPTSGGGGGIKAVLLPEMLYFQFPVSRSVDAERNVIIEGVGVQPTIKVPVDEQTVISAGDPVLDAAIQHLDDVTR